jgi:hypothetical protein
MPYTVATGLSFLFNKLSGMAKFSIQTQALTFLALFACAEANVQINQSNQIFYDLPILPNSTL